MTHTSHQGNWQRYRLLRQPDQSRDPRTTASKPDYRSKCAIVIPTFNAGRHWQALHEGLTRQGVDKDQVLIVDSTSTDETRALVEKSGYRLVVRPTADFRHGRTRQTAAALLPAAEVLVFMTQDAILYDQHSLANLLSSFENPLVGAAYGRQLPRPGANAIERHGRLFNYPDCPAMRDFASRTSMGFRSAYFSNSFAGYRRSAFQDVQGFPDHVIVSEDVSVAARMLLKGWNIAYCSEAKVIHSHEFSLGAEFSRYFDISVHHQQESWIIEQFGSVGGEGRKFVLSELRYLRENSPQLIPLAILRSAIKWSAYQCGRREASLPLWLKRAFSSNPGFWTGTDLRTAPKVAAQPDDGASALDFQGSQGSGRVVR